MSRDTRGMPVYIDPFCVQTWQLDDWTKELMGQEWVDDFEKWADVNLPKQPAIYFANRFGHQVLIAHPELVKRIR